jgi:hypothetical protein
VQPRLEGDDDGPPQVGAEAYDGMISRMVFAMMLFEGMNMREDSD